MPERISNDGETLFFQALTGHTLYAIDTDLLRQDVPDAPRATGVRRAATTHVADGLGMSKAGVRYLTSPADYSIKRLSGTTLETVLTNASWPSEDTVIGNRQMLHLHGSQLFASYIHQRS